MESKITNEQKEVLLSFMEDHINFGKGKLMGVEGKKLRSNLWEVLATQLNNCSGPTKSVEKWQRVCIKSNILCMKTKLKFQVWVDLKNKVKKKAGDIKKNKSQTGGGPETTIKLTEFELRVISFLSEEAIHGLDDIDGSVFDSAEPGPSTCSSASSSGPIANAIGSKLLQSPEPVPCASTMQPIHIFHDHNYLNLNETLPTDDTNGNFSTPSRGRKRKNSVRDNQKLAADFVSNAERQPAAMENISNKMDEMVKEMKTTNILFKDFIDVLKKITNL